MLVGMGSGLLSPWHIAIIVMVLLLVFGAKRLPELGRGLGSGMREFKDAVTGGGSHDESRPAVPAVTEQPPNASQPPAPPQPPAASQAPAESSQPAPTTARSD
jgi:sec-independent protein translocase protein TatA